MRLQARRRGMPLLLHPRTDLEIGIDVRDVPDKAPLQAIGQKPDLTQARQIQVLPVQIEDGEMRVQGFALAEGASETGKADHAGIERAQTVQGEAHQFLGGAPGGQFDFLKGREATAQKLDQAPPVEFRTVGHPRKAGVRMAAPDRQMLGHLRRAFFSRFHREHDPRLFQCSPVRPECPPPRDGRQNAIRC